MFPLHPCESALVHQVDLRTPQLHLRNFVLHRHPADGGEIDAPRQRWSRAILHLAGSGELELAGRRVTVEPGVVIVLPPGRVPVSSVAGYRPRLRLEIDFRLRRFPPAPPACAVVNPGELAQIREQLNYFLRIQSAAGEILGWEGAVVILQLAITLLRAAGWLERVEPTAVSNGDSAMHRLLLAMKLESPLLEVVARSGYQRDHLNRLVKRETGLTLGQFRTQRRLTRAKELLAQGVKVGEVAGIVGLPDQSYFARWFRRQTGQSPSRWMQPEPPKPAADLILQCG